MALHLAGVGLGLADGVVEFHLVERLDFGQIVAREYNGSVHALHLHQHRHADFEEWHVASLVASQILRLDGISVGASSLDSFRPREFGAARIVMVPIFHVIHAIDNMRRTHTELVIIVA